MIEFQPMRSAVATERLVMRSWRADDAEVVRALWLERDPRVPQRRRIGADGHPTVADLEEQIAAHLVDSARSGIATLAIERADRRGPIGYCGLVAGQGTLEEPEIAFELVRAAQGHGYATEAARAVVELARETGRRRLWATVWQWNEPSLRVLRRLGFVDAGRRDEDPKHGDSLWLTKDLRSRSPKVVVMGVSGSGKTTVGERLVEALGATFVEGDDLHPQANRDTMAAGYPLTDDDRWPWLDVVARTLQDAAGPVVASCSSLKLAYRDRIRATAPAVLFVHLDGDPDLLRERQAGREGHFMPTSLMTSQLETLEPLQPDEAGVRLDVADAVDELVRAAVAAVHRDEQITPTR